jgi:hypothetical protein
MSPTSLVKLIRDVDTHVHYLAAKRILKGDRINMTLKEWEAMYDKLLSFAGTPHAKRLIRYAKV